LTNYKRDWKRKELLLKLNERQNWRWRRRIVSSGSKIGNKRRIVEIKEREEPRSAVPY
jgi:hypothetical protein